MYTLIQSIRLQTGKMAEAIPWAKEVVALGDKLGWGEITVHVEVFGAAGRLHWIGTAPDLATIERIQAEGARNEEYQAWIARGVALEVGVPGTLQNLLLRRA
jgi:hypothetical protein